MMRPGGKAARTKSGHRRGAGARRWCGLFALLLLAGCGHSSPNRCQGYIEGEYVYVSSPLAGILQMRPVERGQQVRAGDPLFALEQEAEVAAAREAEQRLAEAKSRLENLGKGRRPSEIAALDARLKEARSSLRLWEAEFARRKKLFDDRVISDQELDQTRNQRDASLAQVEALQADLETARLGARIDEVKAAEAQVEASAAALAKARWSVEQKMQKSPVTGYVQDTLYRVGEWVAAGNPVVSLLPPENVKVRFFVPEPRLGAVAPGREVKVHIDGTSGTLSAKVSYVSSQAEFTPPVIYSREVRAKLVYLVEALFARTDAMPLRPGQPADVELNP